MLHNNPALKSLIDKLWNKFWSGGIANPLTAIEQITYLIFIKKIDDLDNKRMIDAQEGYSDSYTSIFSGTYTKLVKETNQNGEVIEVQKEFPNEELRWFNFKELPAEEMLPHVQHYVFPFIKKLDKKESHFTKYMQNAVLIIPSAALLVEAVLIIDELFKVMLEDSQKGGQTFQDIQGDVYEMLLSEIATAGKMGQFRTPRHIIKLLTELVDPQIGEKIGDPACGSAGFLLGAYQYLITSLDTKKEYSVKDEDGFIRSNRSGFVTSTNLDSIHKSLNGYDIDVTMVRLGLMNLMMHGVNNPKIQYLDTLSKRFDHQELGTYHKILANPPFKGTLDNAEKDGETLSINTSKTELLFIDRIHTMLRDGGTAGVIVPQGVLFGSTKAFVDTRKIMIDQSQLHAVITMPSGVFKPYAGVATAILIFTKANETDDVWFYEMENDGYSLDDKRSKISKSDLQKIIEQFRNRKNQKNNDRTQKYFLVPKEEIVNKAYNLNLSTYREMVFEEEKYREPDEVFQELENIEKEIVQSLASLKSLF